jgi:hypothetical protein
MKATIIIICSLFATITFAQRPLNHSNGHLQSSRPALTITPMANPTPIAVGAAIEVKNVTANQYQQKFDELTKKGYQPIKIEVKHLQVMDYTDGEKPQLGYWATFQKYNNGYAYVARHNLTAAQYQAEFDTYTKQGYMPISVGVGAVDANEKYAVIFEKVPNPPAWVARHNLTQSAFATENKNFTQQGYKVKSKASCVKNGATIYAAIWVK